MGLLKRLFQREEPVEVVCQRCGVPAPPNTIECAACGWDLREATTARSARAPPRVRGPLLRARRARGGSPSG